MKKVMLSTVASTVILFLWSGLTQALPWGVPTTQNVSVQTSAPETEVPNLIQLPVGSLTTEEFEAYFIDKVSTYTTDKTFSWIVTQPLRNDYSRYFALETVTQFVVALLLACLLALTAELDIKRRMLIVFVAGLAAVSGIYGQLMNWWALPPSYALGVSLNLVIGWMIASLVSARFIIKKVDR